MRSTKSCERFWLFRRWASGKSAHPSGNAIFFPAWYIEEVNHTIKEKL